MSGTCLKCMKCGKVFRRIHGNTTEELSKILTPEESKKFKGDDFNCCGKEYLKTLSEIGMTDELKKLQIEWISVMKRLYTNKI